MLPGARFIWSYGLDHGTYDGHAVDNYAKDLPLARLDDSVLIATELNGAPLPPEHGFPARLLVPGYYGTNSVKWLDRIVLAERRADGCSSRPRSTTTPPNRAARGRSGR